MTSDQEHQPAYDDGSLAEVNAAIDAARRTVEETKAVIEESRRLLRESHHLIQPIKAS